MTYDESSAIGDLIDSSTKIIIIQADNPDGDSLGSALALEQILGDLGKEPTLYCGVDIPTYLHHMPGWDRVEKEIDTSFDVSIIVDTSSLSLLSSSVRSNIIQSLSKKPCIVIDHHDVDDKIDFATIDCNKKAVATGEVIYEIAQDLKWKLNDTANERIANSILSDSLGLTTEATSPRSIYIIGDLVAAGVSISSLDDARRDLMRKSPELVKFKGELLQKLEYFDNNRIVTVDINWAEIEKYSQSYNPSMLVIDDMRLVEGACVAIAFKIYRDGKITAKIRCNFGSPIAGDLSKHFGGGGHSYASGFKINSSDNKNLNDIKNECIEVCVKLLDNLNT